jgi:hypothetical protein
VIAHNRKTVERAAARAAAPDKTWGTSTKQPKPKGEAADRPRPSHKRCEAQFAFT